MRMHAGLWGVALAGLCAAAPVRAEGITASDALKDMLAGNETYQKNEVLAKRRASTAQGQSPQAIVLSCSDSRVPPEAVFNRYLGRLFIVRTAGHAVGDFEFASIEYAVEHLHTPLLVVLGHERCGAIKATVDAVQGGGAGHDAGHGGAAEPATPGGSADPAGDDDADHGHKKSHRADRSSTDEDGQRAGACAPAKQAHDAEDDAEAGDEEPEARPAKAKGKTAKKAKAAKSDKKKKLTRRARPAEDADDADADAEDEDADVDDDRPARARRTKGRGPADAESDAPAEDDEAAADAEEATAPAKGHGHAGAGHGATEHISSLVAELEAPVRAALEGKPADPVDAAVRVNTKWVAKRLVDESGVIREAVSAGKLRIVGARYDLDTGAVEILE